MLSHAINRFTDSHRWLDPLADVLQKVTTAVYGGGPATVPQVRYDVRIQDGRVELRRSPATRQPT